MEVSSGNPTGCACRSNLLATFDPLAFAYLPFVKVEIKGFYTLVIPKQDHISPSGSIPTAPNHLRVIKGVNWRADWRAEVNPTVPNFLTEG
jgi:hypothetical protein